MTEVFTDPVLTNFDWRAPDYAPIIKARMRRLMALREQPELIGHLKRVYRDQPWRFINDWGSTSDPRHVEVGLPVTIPFILFPRQIEWCEWLVERWKAREPGATVKSRDMGITWLSVAMTTTMCMFYDDLAVGFGSRKLELVDSLGDPKCIFWKARKFIELAPSEFTGQWSSREKLISFGNGSTIAGEGGDDIGRGARTALYVVDEAANVQHQESVDAALSATSNCRQFVSTPRGSDNAFAEKVTNWPERRVFRFHWREDPRKDDEWYAKQKEELDPVVLAQEVDMDFNASKDGVVIPQEHVQAALDAHIHLNLDGRGERRAALDIADEGMDNCAWATARGIVLDHIEEWSGKGSNLYQTTVRAFGLCDRYDIDDQLYDADGMGAHMKGDAQQLNAARRAEGIATQRPPHVVNVVPFWGSGAVERKDSPIYPGAKRLNGDYYKNLKAQSWGELQYRFRETWRARNIPDYKYDPDRLISISSAIPARVRSKLMMELSQPTWGPDPTGKMIVDKKPDIDGRKAKSPNMADVVMMLFGAARRRMVISPEAMRRA